jgi:tight adherence protein B
MEQALPDAMTKLGALLSAGQPLHQAIVELPERIDPVLRTCFSQLRADLKVGISLADSLKRQERRLELEEFVAFASCVRVGLASGGTLAPSIERLAGDMRKRLNLRDEAKSADSAGSGTSMDHGGTPCVDLNSALYGGSEWLPILIQTSAGRTALSIAVAMNLLGAFWVRRCLN